MAQSNSNGDKPKCIFVFDNMRARSHLFFRWLSTSSELDPIYHPYMMSSVYGRQDTFLRFTKNSEARQKENFDQMTTFFAEETIDSASVKLQDAIAKAQLTGKIPLVNEHCNIALKHSILFSLIRDGSNRLPAIDTNPSFIPDGIFNTATTIVVIRNPLLQIPSIYKSFVATTQCRPGDEDFTIATSSKTYRLLFDVLHASGRTPIVVDGEDVLWRTEDLAANVCAALGIDSTGITDQWDPIPESKRPTDNPIILAWTKTIWESSGIERPAEEPDQPNMEAEYKMWTEQHGEDVAKQLKKHVDANMPHYEYLRRFRA